MQLPILEALHQAHLLLQIGKNFVAGHNQGRGRHVRQFEDQLLQRCREDGSLVPLSSFLRLEYQDGKRREATQDYHGSGRPHLHQLDFVSKTHKTSDLKALDLQKAVAATAEQPMPWMEGVVLASQMDRTGRSTVEWSFPLRLWNRCIPLSSQSKRSSLGHTCVLSSHHGSDEVPPGRAGGRDRPKQFGRVHRQVRPQIQWQLSGRLIEWRCGCQFCCCGSAIPIPPRDSRNGFATLRHNVPTVAADHRQPWQEVHWGASARSTTTTQISTELYAVPVAWWKHVLAGISAKVQWSGCHRWWAETNLECSRPARNYRGVRKRLSDEWWKGGRMCHRLAFARQVLRAMVGSSHSISWPDRAASNTRPCKCSGHGQIPGSLPCITPPCGRGDVGTASNARGRDAGWRPRANVKRTNPGPCQHTWAPHPPVFERHLDKATVGRQAWKNGAET